MTHPIRSVLATMVGPGTLLTEEESGQWRSVQRYSDLPVVALAPATEEEMAAVLARASEEGWRVLPAGSGSWLEGGGPSNVSLVVTTGRMREMYEYEPAALTFTSGAGLTLDALREATIPHGQWLPLDPPGGLQGSLGATVSLGMGGPLRHLYGTPRDHVLGLTLVSGDGRILRWGGTLAISGESLAHLLPLARAMATSSLPLAAVELLGPLQAGGSAQQEGGWGSESPALALRLLGTRAQVAEMEARIGSELAQETWIPGKLEGEASEAFHRGLNGWEKGFDLVLRLSLLPSELGTLLAEAQELEALGAGGRSAADVHASAHVGAGVLRVAVSGLDSERTLLEPWISALGALRTRLEERGGTLTVSSGPPTLMKDLGPWGTPGGEERLLKGLKDEFDRKGILSPGRLGL